MDTKINEDEFINPYVFKTDWKTAFEDEEFAVDFLALGAEARAR